MRSFVRFLGSSFPGALAPVAAVAFALAAAAADAAPAPSIAPVSVPAAAGVPVAVAGDFLGIVDGALAVQETDGDGPVAFPLTERLEVTRGGEVVALDALRNGDRLRMTVDGTTGSVLRVDAEPAAAPPFAPSGEVALLAAVGLVGAGALLVVRNRRPAAPAPAAQPDPLRDFGGTRLAPGQREVIRLSFERPARAS